MCNILFLSLRRLLLYHRSGSWLGGKKANKSSKRRMERVVISLRTQLSSSFSEECATWWWCVSHFINSGGFFFRATHHRHHYMTLWLFLRSPLQGGFIIEIENYFSGHVNPSVDFRWAPQKTCAWRAVKFNGACRDSPGYSGCLHHLCYYRNLGHFNPTPKSPLEIRPSGKIADFYPR